MSKHIIWYNLSDGSYGSCPAEDMLIIDDDTLTMDEGRALYEASQDGDEEQICDLIVGIHERQNPEVAPCG
jgi:hypothetical protein